MGKKKIFEYIIRDIRYEVVTRFCPVVIDFGFATITIDGKSVGVWGHRDIGVFPTYPRPLCDFVRLVNNCYKIKPIFQEWALQYCFENMETWYPLSIQTIPQDEEHSWDKVQYADIFLCILSEYLRLKQIGNQ